MKKAVSLCVLVPIFLCACVTFDGRPQNQPKRVYLEVAAGTVSVKATSLMRRGLEYRSSDRKSEREESALDRIVLADKDARRLDTEMVLSVNEKFEYLLADSEVITFEIDAIGGNDAEVVLYEQGSTKSYAVKSGAQFGLMLSCGN